MAKVDLKEKRQYFPEHMDSAFDLSSGGMGVHLHSVDHFAKGKELPKWAKGSLFQPNSNYLVNPYVFGWAWKQGMDPFFKEEGPYKRSSHSEASVRLLDHMNVGYDELRRHQLRIVLSGEETVTGAEPGAHISETEFVDLLKASKKSGLVNFEGNEPPKIVPPDDDFSFAVNVTKAGVDIDSKLWQEWEVIKLSERFRDRTLQLATYKLGAMLGLTEQLTFDAQALGVPYPATYRPGRDLTVWEANWQKMFGEDMPDLSGLYEKAHQVFVENSAKEDPLTAYLIPLTSLPNLA